MHNQAHVFQHKTSGVQIFVYHQVSIGDARQKFRKIVNNVEDWVFLCKKVAHEVYN